MSGSLVKRRAIQFVRYQYQQIEPGTQLLASIIESVDDAILQLVYDAAFYAHQDLELALERTIPITYHSCLIHLADDIADGDCDYIDNPISQGVTAVYTLLHLFNRSLAQCKIQDTKIFDALIDVGLWQHKEIATQTWDLESAKEVAVGINARQFEAYFRIVSSGTQHEKELANAGYAYAVAAHLSNDINSEDNRFYDIPNEERNKLIDWALELSKSSPLPFESGHVYEKGVLQTLVHEAQLNLR